MSLQQSGLKHLYEPVEAYDIDEESREERAKIAHSIETHRRSKIIRKSYLVFPFLVILILIVYTTRKMKFTEGIDPESDSDSTSTTTDDKSDEVETSYQSYEASVSQTDDVVVAEFLHGKDWLFDFNTYNGGLENVNSYYDENYASDLSYLTERATYWSNLLAEPEIADESGQKSKWNKNGGVCPWRTDSNDDREIEQIYNYAGAPNIVMFVVDDWGSNDIGYQSDYLGWTTPNTDKLASNGIKLGNYYTHEWCVPSRAALMTGRYGLRFGMHAPDDSAITSMELPLAEVTIAEELKSAGYRTNLVGKWHLGWSTNSRTPYHRGFDYFYGFLGAKIDYWTKEFDNFLDLRENDSTVSDESEISEDLHTAYLYAKKAEEVIKTHSEKYSDQPMFLYYGSQLIHTSWSAPQSFIDRCGVEEGTATQSTLTYCAMNLLLDEAIGNLTCALDKYGMADNTVFILVSDNGGILSMDGNNAPFRGSKGSMLRGANNVPAFIVGPSSLIPSTMKGKTYDGQVHVTDWLPTLMGLATGGAWKGGLEGATIDGVDAWNAITTNSDSPHSEIVHYVDDTGSICIQIDGKKLLITSVGVLGPHSEADQIFVGDTPESNVCLFG